MKIKVSASLSAFNSVTDIIEIDDEEIENLDQSELEEYLDNFWSDWVTNNLEGNAAVLENGEE